MFKMHRKISALKIIPKEHRGVSQDHWIRRGRDKCCMMRQFLEGLDVFSVCGKVLNIRNPGMGQKMQHEIKGHIRQWEDLLYYSEELTKQGNEKFNFDKSYFRGFGG